VDAVEKADQLLSAVVSRLYSSGLNQDQSLNKMPALEEELARRLWWSVLQLDRQLAIEVNRPIMIQEGYGEIPLPRNLHNDWLSRQANNPKTSLDLAADIEHELGKTTSSLIDFVTAMVSYGRAAAKVWKALYHTFILKVQLGPMMTNYLEDMLSRAEKEASFRIKQERSSSTYQILMRIVCQSYMGDYSLCIS
jgi:hypothetical protein